MKLFEPGKIGRLSLKNRLVMAAMGIGGLAEGDGRFSQRAIDYYEARARGGTGLIIAGAAKTQRSELLAYAPLINDIVIDGKLAVGRLSELVDVVHDYGAKVGIQLNAGYGRMSSMELLRGGSPPAPSKLPCFFDPKVMTREMTVEEIEELAQSFQYAAEAVRTAGMDVLELNNHGGYLAEQFLSSLWNRRKDEYGGNLDGRLRFLLGVIEKVRKGAGADFPIIVKFPLMHGLDGGREVDEGLEIARRLEAAGVSALEIDAGCYETWYLTKPTTYSQPGSIVGMAEQVKKAVSIPVIAIGKLGFADLAERVLQEGKADFICLGRALLADPDWPNKVKEGKLEDIRPCIGDHEGCSSRIAQNKYISCVVNPVTGMEKQLDITRAERKKSVLVVGGGPGGLEAARVAALRGHWATLWERENALGGNLIPAAIPGFKQDYRDLIKFLVLQAKKAGVAVQLNTEATLESVRQLRPDAVVVATGSTPFIPEIPGVNGGNVITAIDLLLGKKKAGERVVVVGGGNVGGEIALYLAQQGKKLTLVARSVLLRNMHMANRFHLLKLLSDADVRTLTDTKTLEITADGVAVADKAGKRSVLKADTVVLAMGARPNSSLFEALKDGMPEVYAIGDCIEPRKVQNAIWEGFRTARRI
ncbi:MAG: FAD-dependent oxidoreductase [Chloroflexi bacterium]|nr:FAD-dependent oxidoreductase [Chloroflexota bacterium]